MSDAVAEVIKKTLALAQKQLKNWESTLPNQKSKSKDDVVCKKSLEKQIDLLTIELNTLRSINSNYASFIEIMSDGPDDSDINLALSYLNKARELRKALEGKNTKNLMYYTVASEIIEDLESILGPDSTLVKQYKQKMLNVQNNGVEE